MKYTLLLLLGILLFLGACSDSKNQNIPKATGLTGDIFLIMDSAQWKGPLGEVMDSLFSREMEGLPREEPIFKMRWIDPRKLNFVLKQRRNLIFAVTFDKKTSGASTIKRLFSSESFDQIKANPELFSQNSQDVFAKGQEVVYLFSQTESQLLKHLRKDGNKIVEFFNVKERERLTQSLYKAGQVKGIPQIVQKDFNCDFKVPFGYKLVQNNNEFIWVRQINSRDDKDVFIARKKYTSQEQFKHDSLIIWRDAICKKYLFADPERLDTYLLTEQEVPYKPVITRETSFNKKFAMEMRGLWRSNNFAIGGPFLSYTVVDEATGWLYYLEGFTISPGKDQREIMRELETILHTFRTSEQITASAK